MFDWNDFSVAGSRRFFRVAFSILLAAVSGVRADDFAAARFKGAPTYDFGVTNVKWVAATPEYSYVTFDLSWSYSWRAKWLEPAKTSVTGKDMEVENWDAAWVFVKFLPEQDSKESIERNHWLHATLDKDSASHMMPAGATNTVKLSDDGARGMGLFIYRDAVGHGRNDWKGIKLRWFHGADKVDPAKAAIRVHPIAMVYVPEGPFKVGTVDKSGYSPFADGPDVPITRYDGENSFNSIPEGLRKIIETTTSKDGGPYLQWAAAPSWSHLTDGAWRGGPMIPFLVDAEWNAPLASGPRARRVGPVARQLWSTLGFSERGGGSGGMFGSQIGGNVPLTDDYPTGYDAFYCMKYELTQGQYADFLNSLPPDVAAGRAFVGSEVGSDAGMDSREVKVDLGGGRSITVVEKGGHTIYSSADVSASAPPPAAREDAAEEKQDGMNELLAATFSDKKGKGSVAAAGVSRPVYAARCPFRKIPGVTTADSYAYAVWAGLRPMSVLEGTKAGVGPRDPAVPADWSAPKNYEEKGVLQDAGLPTERITKGRFGYGSDLATRVGCRSTPTSDRGEALATYWGISELDGPSVPLIDRGFRGTHGHGATSAGQPGASFKRTMAPFKEMPADWPAGRAYTGGHFVGGNCRLVASADNRIKKPAPAELAAAGPTAPSASQLGRADTIKVSNVKWEAGTKEYSTVSFDLAWNNSWRAKWEELAEKNVAGKPLKLESWDAAWVFVKFRPAGDKDELHATLDVQAKDHAVPAGADLDVGPTDDGTRGTGVFIYRKGAGAGANDFKGIKLRWLHEAGQVPDPTVQVRVYALAMVYVPDGPFASRSPWGHALTVISTPDATKPGGHLESGPETMPLDDAWPNGFSAYYCMKYSITQGEYADFLNSIRSLKYNAGRYGAMAMENRGYFNPAFYNFNGYTITTNAAGVFRADVPDRRCNMLSLFDIQGFIAWAGLRMPTNLEYEKACRGPRAVASGADAWKPATCAPATGLDKSVLGEPPAVGPGPSYWGIRELSLSGCVQEWPVLIQNEAANPSMKMAGIGVKLVGDHGSGSPEIPEHWPWTCFGEWYAGGIWRLWGYGTVGHWVAVEDLNRLPFTQMDMSRTGRYGVRAVRTAPITVAANAMLQIDALPKLTGIDIGVFYLSGRLNNTSDNPLNVELSAPLSDVCFLDGAASRALTAAPKAVTPFKIAMAVTRQSMMTGAIRGGILLPVQLKGKDGQALETLLVPIQMGARAGAPLPVISSIRGGEVALRITNTTERSFTLAVRLSPVGVTLATTNTSVSIAAGAGTQVVSAAPRQAFNQAGACRIPYGIAVATAAPQSGEAAVELRTESRWWITKRVKNAPKAGAPDEGPGGEDDLGGALAGLGDLVSYDGSIFKADKPPKDWTPLTCGASIAFGDAGKLPSQGSAMLSATRVEAATERDAVVAVPPETLKAAGKFDYTVWFNDALVFKLGADQKKESKPFRIRKTGNTMMVECRSAENKAATPGEIVLKFNDAKDGRLVNDLVFDMEKK
jgi:formylglycine-generating enzyme required for sulfatase activity